MTYKPLKHSEKESNEEQLKSVKWTSVFILKHPFTLHLNNLKELLLSQCLLL